ncbi:MAG: Putative transcriptional regulator, AsnC family [Thermoanaerobacterales bacterium 50_218]|nr:MAG: Putative transcriptional regulator, AsnC family [Thermoanaerobacterales bacterium 50_218]
MLDDLDKEIVQVLQEGIPLVKRPYFVLAQRLGISEEKLLAKIQDFLAQGIIRRFGAVVCHRDLGYTANVMVVWAVPEERLEEVGQLMAGFDQVSHCYQRSPSLPEWPYNLYTMIHGRTPEECYRAVKALSQLSGVTDYQMLFSVEELKKTSMKYFSEPPFHHASHW